MTRRQTWLRTAYRAHTVLTLVVVATLLVLNFTDVLSGEVALLLFLKIELPLAAVFLVFTALRFTRRGRSPEATDSGFLDRLETEEPLLRPVVLELRAFGSLGLAVAGKRQVPPGAKWFGYAKGSLTFAVVMVVVSVVELVVVHVLVPWAWLRIVLLVLTAWGVLFVFGFFATRIVRPHFITEGMLHLRWGHQAVLTTPLSNIVSAARLTNHSHTHPHIEGGRLILTQFQSTNLLIRFDVPVAAAAPVSKKHLPAGFRASEVQLYVDDPDGFLHVLSQFPNVVTT